MNKKDFKQLIERHKSIYKCLIIEDATVRYDHPHCAIKIVWENIGTRTTIKTMRGKVSDIKSNEMLDKYRRWVCDFNCA